MNKKRIVKVLSMLIVFVLVLNSFSISTHAAAKGFNQEVTTGVYLITFSGNDHLSDILKKNNASGKTLITNVNQYISDNYTKNIIKECSRYVTDINFGCRSVTVPANSGYLSGRNFDYNDANSIVIVKSKPSNGYASISTVDASLLGVDRISKTSFMNCSRNDLALMASYAAVDGMNERGLYVSILMVHSGSGIHQNGNGNDVTPSLMVKAILNKCKTVEEAKTLVKKYDMNCNCNFHLAISDKNGKSGAIEWKNGKVSYSDTKVVVNQYVSKNTKNNTDGLLTFANSKNKFTVNNVKDALSKAKQPHTQWSVVYNTSNKSATYYFKKNYSTPYIFSI